MSAVNFDERKLNIKERIEKFLKINNFKSKQEFVDSLARFAARVWEESDLSNPYNIYKDTSTDNLPKTKEDIKSKIQEIKNRDAGAWENYMVAKEVYGVDLIHPPDIDTKALVPKPKRPDPTNNKGIFRRLKDE